MYSGILFISFSVNIIFLPSTLPILSNCFQTSFFKTLVEFVIAFAGILVIRLAFVPLITLLTASLPVSTKVAFTKLSTAVSESDLVASFIISAEAVTTAPPIILLAEILPFLATVFSLSFIFFKMFPDSV